MEFDELDFLSISNSNFAGYTGSKNQVQTRQKFQFIKLDFSNSIFQNPNAGRYHDRSNKIDLKLLVYDRRSVFLFFRYIIVLPVNVNVLAFRFGVRIEINHKKGQKNSKRYVKTSFRHLSNAESDFD